MGGTTNDSTIPKNSPVWKWPGFERLQSSQQLAMNDVLEAVFEFLMWSSAEENQRKVLGYILARLLALNST